HPGPNDGGSRKPGFRSGLGSAITRGRRVTCSENWPRRGFRSTRRFLLAGWRGGVTAFSRVPGPFPGKGGGPPLWREGETAVDHKRIRVMYVVLGLVMLARGYSDAIMMRTQQAIAVGDAQGYLPPDHYNQIFSAHGVIMIFFVAMPLVIGLMNFAVPLQLGVR